MAKDDRDLLDILKFELEFLEAGGYGRSPRTPQKPTLIFEDSLTCLNYYHKENRQPCNDCLLMQFVPAARHAEEIPCRHIPLNETGKTIDSLYRAGTQIELEEAMRDWLHATIQRLEEERTHLDQGARSKPQSER
jgi:hypothetical protein